MIFLGMNSSFSKPSIRNPDTELIFPSGGKEFSKEETKLSELNCIELWALFILADYGAMSEKEKKNQLLLSHQSTKESINGEKN